VDRATQPDEKTRDGAGFEEVEECGRVRWIGRGGVLWTPVSVRDGDGGLWDRNIDIGGSGYRGFGGELNPQEFASGKILHYEFGRISVGGGGIGLVFGENVGDGANVEADTITEPVEATNYVSESGFGFIFGHLGEVWGVWDFVDWASGAIWSHR